MFYRGSLDRNVNQNLATAIRESEPLISGMILSSSNPEPDSSADPHGSHSTPHAATVFAPVSLTPFGTSGEGRSTRGPDLHGGDFLDLYRHSMSPTVESAEEILQAVEAQLEQSPLLSRRSSISAPLVTRPGRSSRSPTSPGWGPSSAAAAAGGGATEAVLAAGGSIGGSTASRASSFGGALPPGAAGWAQHQQQQQQHRSDRRLTQQLPTQQYQYQHQQQQQQPPKPAQQEEQLQLVEVTAGTVVHSQSTGQLVSTASFSAGFIGEACDAAAGATRAAADADAAASKALTPPQPREVVRTTDSPLLAARGGSATAAGAAARGLKSPFATATGTNWETAALA
ncbi:hypothetical protein VaNZ11_007880, partial [Volvox africanus]